MALMAIAGTANEEDRASLRRALDTARAAGVGDGALLERAAGFLAPSAPAAMAAGGKSTVANAPFYTTGSGARTWVHGLPKPTL